MRSNLFAADDPNQLEEVLASMPLRVWRTDEVMPLAPHPNDPGLARGGAVEFLITMTIAVPEGTPHQTVEDTKAREAERVNWPSSDTSSGSGLRRPRSASGKPPGGRWRWPSDQRIERVFLWRTHSYQMVAARIPSWRVRRRRYDQLMSQGGRKTWAGTTASMTVVNSVLVGALGALSFDPQR